MNDRLPEGADASDAASVEADPIFGIEPQSAARIRSLCDTTVGLANLWIFGSRARGDHRAQSDIDLEADAPDWTRREHLAFADALKRLPIVYPIDCVWRQGNLPDELRERIRRDGRVFWAPRGDATDVASTAGKPPG